MLTKIFLRHRERRGDLRDPDRQLLIAFGLDPENPIRLNPRTLVSYSPALRAIRIISEALSSAPLNKMEREITPEGRERKRVLRDDPVHFLVHDEPNEMMNSAVFRQVLMLHTLTYGNGFAFIERNLQTGRPVALLPLDPRSTRAVIRNGELFYQTTEEGKNFFLSADDVLSIPWLSWDGVTGESPAYIARRSLGLGMAAEEAGLRFFEQGMLQNVAIEQQPGIALNETALENLKEAIRAKFSGLRNIWRPLVLQPGLSIKQMSVDLDKAQAKDILEMGVANVARIYGVPLHLLASMSTGAQSYASVEQFGLVFLKHTMLPWFTLWEQELNRKLLGRNEFGRRFFKFNVDFLARGDLLSRMQAHQIGINAGLLTINEGRALEDRDASDLPEADVPLIQASNLRPLSHISMENNGENSEPQPQRKKREKDILLWIARQCVQRLCDTGRKIFEKHGAQRDRLEAELRKGVERIQRDYSILPPERIRIFERQLLQTADPNVVFELWAATGAEMLLKENEDECGT